MRPTSPRGCRKSLACVLLGAACALGAAPSTRPAATRPAGAPVPMDFPAEGVDLRVLADVVTKRLGIPILYDEQVQGKRVIVRVPVDVPEEALLGVLQSALRMKQLALVDAEQPGWKKIVPAQNLAAVARPVPAGEALPAGEVVSQAFVLKGADPGRIAEAIRPMLTQPGGNVQVVPGTRSLVVSDYSATVARAGEVIALLDGEGAAVEVRFIPLAEADAAAVATLAQAAVAARDTAGGTAGAVTLAADERGNQVMVVAPAERMKELEAMVRGLDRPAGLKTRVFRLQHVSPERVDRLVKGLMSASPSAAGSAGPGRSYQATVDAEGNALVVSGTPEALARVEAIVKELDAPAAAAAHSPMRFHKLKNAKAADVLATIASLYGDEGPGEGAADEPERRMDGEARRGSTVGRAAVPGPSRPGEGPTAGAAQPAMEGTVAERRSGNLVPRDAGSSAPATAADGAPAGSSRAPSYAAAALSGRRGGEGRSAGGAAVRAGSATVTADANTNSIIVIAPPEVQQLYADVIAKLDVRRPQVQVECTIVTLDTSDGFTFGVDVGKTGGGWDDNQLITFSSFGIAVVDPATGGLTPTRGRGGTFALLAPGIADVVLRALANNSRSRLVSAPSLLVNDNGRGKLQSVAQEPYAEILDTGTQQSRTGLGGLAQAGTTIVVEPQISEDEHLQLTYSIELSSFTGAGRDGLPPPSAKNTVDSTVTIPDGHTIVVGGLSVRNVREEREGLPLLNQVPIVRDVFGTRSRTARDTTLFVFIRPVVMRDDKFQDLKYLSEKKAAEAGVPGSYPESEPVPMR